MGISLGLVGLGAFGKSFAPLFKSHPLVDRIALCDMEPERVARFAEDPSFQDKFDAKDAFDSFEAILDADLDALVIITQPWLHAEQAVRGMEAGKHVYSAVPIVSLPDGNEILDWCNKIVTTAQRTGKRYMLGETTFYRPQTMYCRRKADEGAFGDFVFGEGEYFHDIEHGLRQVAKRRLSSKSGQLWVKRRKKYEERGVISGSMHYPTHSVAGPVSVMNAHMTKVAAWGQGRSQEDESVGSSANYNNETALFRMSNGASVRICEHRRIGTPCREMFSVFGTKGGFRGNDGKAWGPSRWFDLEGGTEVSVNEMRDPLPEDVYAAFEAAREKKSVYGGHGGSHPFLVHEFVSAVAEDRQPAVNAWEAVRYMAPGVMAHQSALKDGELLDVPDWGDAPE